MNKPLIIVESPTKAKVIDKFLGGSHKVISSMGHVMDLPKKKLGVDIEKDFEPQYEAIRGKGKIIKEIAGLMKKADRVYLGMDEDREGEAIGWHILQAAGNAGAEKEADRIVFHEITRRAIENALESPRRIDMNLVDAQKARRILDRIVGYKVSSLISKKIRRGLSAGRVQSPALRLIVNREQEREAFTSRDYYTVEGKLGKENICIEAALWGRKGKKIKKFDLDKETADKVVDECSSSEAVIAKIGKKSRKNRPYAPFITSTLQQEAYSKLKMTPYATMREAQRLYEGVDLPDGSTGGLITYMRTDSVKIAREAVESSRKYITAQIGPEYVPEKPNFYKSKKSAQEAHECIRPTDVNIKPEDLKDTLDKNQYRLYELIWRRFVACQMKPAVLEMIKVDMECSGYNFRSNGQKIIFDGYNRIWQADIKEQNITGVKKGDLLNWEKLEALSHQTQPPPRYTMATLVKELENNGIGRPSTYASILNTLFKRKYVFSDKGRLIPYEIAFEVIEGLQDHFQTIVDLEFTAKMEENLDLVAEGKMQWKEMLEEFYKSFKDQLIKAAENMERTKDEETDKICPSCQEPMVIRRGRNGKFLACTGFPDCKTTYNIDEDGNIVKEKESGIKCPKCSSAMIERNGRYGKFLACSKFPACKTTLAIDKEGELIEIPIGFEKCPECGKDTTIKRGRKGMFLACSGYPKCRFSMNYEKALEKSRK